MHKFIYWNNKDKFHDFVVLEVEAESISEADKVFQKEIGKHPASLSWVGCQGTHLGELNE